MIVGDVGKHIGPRAAPVKIERSFLIAAVLLGMTSTVTQIILLREFLSVFYGNELVIGIMLAGWMMLTGAGSFFGKTAVKTNAGTSLPISLLVLLATLPTVTVFLLRFLRNVVFPVGSLIGIVQVLWSSLVLLAPYCLLSGFLFTLLAQRISERYDSNLISIVYSWESIGSVIGGAVFGILMLQFLKTFQILILLMACGFGIIVYVSRQRRGLHARYAFLAFSVLVLAVTVSLNLDDRTKAFLFKDQNILYHSDTPYGSLTVTEQGGQKNFYENNSLLFSTNDVTLNEESVHYAMVQHPKPERVLLISGGISGTTKEILKYNVKRIDYVELNPWIIEIGKKYTTALADEKVRVIDGDARLFVKKTPDRYDVALISLPDPETAQINRFYTIEFFRELKGKLNNGAVVSLGITSSADYLSDEARRVRSIIYATLQSAFKNVLIVPGMKDYFLASDGQLDIQIGRMIGEKGIVNAYVNQYYLDDQLLQQRSNYILNTLDRKSAVNRDFEPISYYRQLLYWLSYFQISYWVPAAVCALLLAALAMKLNAVSFGIFTGGFAASSIEILLLISFQIVYGYVYLVTGIILTIFMAGLAVGSLYRHKIVGRADIGNYVKTQMWITVYAVMLPIFLHLMKAASGSAVIIHTAFFLLTFTVALLVGAEFSVAARLQRGVVGSVASELYGIDLWGSAAGALIASTFLIPLLGIAEVSYLVASLTLVSALVAFGNRKKYASAYA